MRWINVQDIIVDLQLASNSHASIFFSIDSSVFVDVIIFSFPLIASVFVEVTIFSFPLTSSIFVDVRVPAVMACLAGLMSVVCSRSYSDISSPWSRRARWKWWNLLSILFPTPGRGGLWRIRWLWICSQRWVQWNPSFNISLKIQPCGL